MTPNQKNGDLFFNAAELRDKGMKIAVDHADAVEPNWSEKAFEALKLFIKNRRGNFMAEQIREYAYAIGLPTPPSLRSWGAVISKAAKQGVIVHVGYSATSNPKAHKTPASLWKSANE